MEAKALYLQTGNDKMAALCDEYALEQQYLNGRRSLQSGDYERARALLLEIRGYKDAANLLLACDYVEAGDLAERGELDPLTITADQYDLVCNGVELSSGAVRNHDPEIMIKAFELVRLGEDDVKAKFPAMYNAFCYGAPPHAGIAPGVDRMVMLLAGEDSIREIIPFPMNKNAQDIMMGAPSEVTQKQLDELHIAVTAHEDE